MSCATERNGMNGTAAGLIDPELIIIICKHCGEPIERTRLIGLSLICPFCGKPQNGQPHVQMTH